MTRAQKQLLAVVAGGIAGVICFVGLTLLLHRRIFDPRIRLTSHRTDLAILVILWVQLVLGLITLPYLAVSTSDGSHAGWPTGRSASPPSAPTPHRWWRWTGPTWCTWCWA
jgi:nitrate reductase gamma subunit